MTSPRLAIASLRISSHELDDTQHDRFGHKNTRVVRSLGVGRVPENLSLSMKNLLIWSDRVSLIGRAHRAHLNLNYCVKTLGK